MKTVFGGLGFMIHQQVHVKDMFVWVFVFLSPGITYLQLGSSLLV